MPTAICPSCHRTYPYSNSAGFRLADHKCNLCHGPLTTIAAYDRARSGIPHKKTGARVECVVCHRKRHSKGGRVRFPPVDFYATQWSGRTNTERTRYPAGSPMCYTHDWIPADPQSERWNREHGLACYGGCGRTFDVSLLGGATISRPRVCPDCWYTKPELADWTKYQLIDCGISDPSTPQQEPTP